MSTTINPPATGQPNSVLSLATPPQKGVSNLQRSFRSLLKHRMAVVGAFILVGIVLYIVIGSFFVPFAVSNFNDPARKLLTPSAEFPFGTDQIGRDILARTIYGGQISLFIGVTAVVLQMVVGTLVGLLAGYLGGVVDSVLMRICEALLSIPQLFLALISVRIFANQFKDFRFGEREFSSTFVLLILVIGLTSWMRIARIIRSVVLSIKEQEYILAANALGVPTWRILMRHVLPNCVAPIVVSATLGIANAILLEAYLGFLGLGVRAPTATWGNIIGDSFQYLLQGVWHFWFFPALLIILTVLGINFFGDGLRDAFDPKSLK